MKTKTKFSALGALLVGSLAFAGQPASTGAQADNTATNKRDRADPEPTADQQKNNQSDVDLAARIRRSVVGDKSLSTYAHNIKIIAENGHVTLKGPVPSQAEKNTVERRASSIAGGANVNNEIEVTP